MSQTLTGTTATGVSSIVSLESLGGVFVVKSGIRCWCDRATGVRINAVAPQVTRRCGLGSNGARDGTNNDRWTGGPFGASPVLRNDSVRL